MTTFDDGLMRTCRLPRFSALLMAFNAPAKLFINTIFKTGKKLTLMLR